MINKNILKILQFSAWAIGFMAGIILIFGIFVSAQNNLEIQACQDSYYFIISHLDTNNNLIYSQSDLSNLSIQLSHKLNITINSLELEPYVKYYSIACNFSSLKLPESYIKGSTNLTINPIGQTQLNIDKSILGYDLDSSIPFFHISFQNQESIKYLKYLFLISSEDYGWEIQGIKFYWIFIAVLITEIIMIFISNRNINKIEIKQ